MQEGLLSGAFTRERIAALPEDDFRRRNPYFTEPQLSVNLKIIARLKELAAQARLTIPMEGYGVRVLRLQ